MHPTRAASILALVGAVFLAAVLLMRALSLGQALTLAAQAAAPRERPTPAVGSYLLSADRTQVYFLQSPMESPLAATIWWMMSIEGGLPIRAAKPEEPAGAFQVHDGIAYLLVDGNTKLEQVSPAGETVISSAHSPDGQTLAFSTQIENGSGRLYVLKKDARMAWLGEEEAYIDLAWSPDGAHLAFVSPRNGVDQLFTVHIGGQQYHQLTTDPTRKSLPRWSPDGKSIAYLARIGGDQAQSIGRATPSPVPLVIRSTLAPGLGAADFEAGQTDLFFIPAAGGVPRQVTDTPEAEESHAWARSSLGDELIYAARVAGASHVAFLYGHDPLTGATRRIYPPLSLDAIQCPSSIPFNSTRAATITMSNTALLPLDMPLALYAGEQPVAYTNARSTAALIETVTLLPGETHQLEWQAPAASGRRTHISAVALIPDPFPIAALRCSTVNTLFGVPNLPLLAVSIPAAIAGMLLCVPRLLQRKKAELWALWLAIPLACAAMAMMELFISR